MKLMLNFFIFYILKCCVVCSIQEDFVDQVLDNDIELWQTASFYQIYIRSFKDSNGDGIGDFQGVIEKLDYIESLGIQAILLSSFYLSPNIDFGYDVIDHKSINSEYGTSEDFRTLLNEAHIRNIKVIIEFIPNHDSKTQQSFILSEIAAAEFLNYYVWVNPKTGNNGENIPPNNWISVSGGSAWTWSEKRRQYYLHTFLEEEPDLNYRDPLVKETMKNVLGFWLENFEIDGIKIGAASCLVEDKDFPNEPASDIDGSTAEDYEYLKHIYTKNQPESYEVIYEWRKYIDEIAKAKNRTIIIIADADDPTFCQSEDGKKLGAHFNLNYNFLALSNTSTAVDIENLINEWVETVPENHISNWLLGNHDTSRVASRVSKSSIDGLNMLISFLPGIQITYNGEEIGMVDGEVDCETQGQDRKQDCTKYPSISRDFERTPFQWDITENSGFSNNLTYTWLPICEEYLECNVVEEEHDPNSHLNIFIQLQQLRVNLSHLNGMFVEVLEDNNTLHVVRYKNASDVSGYSQFNFLYHFDDQEIHDLYMDTSLNFPRYQIVFTNGNSNKSIGDIVHPEAVFLEPYEALILTPLPIDDDNGSILNSLSGINYLTTLILTYILF